MLILSCLLNKFDKNACFFIQYFDVTLAACTLYSLNIIINHFIMHCDASSSPLQWISNHFLSLGKGCQTITFYCKNIFTYLTTYHFYPDSAPISKRLVSDPDNTTLTHDIGEREPSLKDTECVRMQASVGICVCVCVCVYLTYVSHKMTLILPHPESYFFSVLQIRTLLWRLNKCTQINILE